jgi:AcrR family transcriptional regulator
MVPLEAAMSRTTNPALTEEIVATARRLWRRRGEKGLTLRAVALAAGTTTPSVYQRFPAKEDLVAAVANQIRHEIGAMVAGSRDFEQAFDRYMQFAKRHPEEYALLASSAVGEILREDGSRPGMEWAREQMARRHGGKPGDYKRTTLAMACLLHGAASFVLHLPAGTLPDDVEKSCRQAILALQQHPIDGKRGRGKRR